MKPVTVGSHFGCSFFAAPGSNSGRFENITDRANGSDDFRRTDFFERPAQAADPYIDSAALDFSGGFAQRLDQVFARENTIRAMCEMQQQLKFIGCQIDSFALVSDAVGNGFDDDIPKFDLFLGHQFCRARILDPAQHLFG